MEGAQTRAQKGQVAEGRLPDRLYCPEVVQHPLLERGQESDHPLFDLKSSSVSFLVMDSLDEALD